MNTVKGDLFYSSSTPRPCGAGTNGNLSGEAVSATVGQPEASGPQDQIPHKSKALNLLFFLSTFDTRKENLGPEVVGVGNEKYD